MPCFAALATTFLNRISLYETPSGKTMNCSYKLFHAAKYKYSSQTLIPWTIASKEAWSICVFSISASSPLRAPSSASISSDMSIATKVEST